MVDECLDECKERSTWLIDVDFFDDDGVAVVPSAATVRIDDEKNRTVIRPETAIGSLATTVTIVVTADENYIIKPRAKSEVRTVTVGFDYGAGRHGNSVYKYKLINLYGVVDVPSASMSPSASASPSV